MLAFFTNVHKKIKTSTSLVEASNQPYNTQLSALFPIETSLVVGQYKACRILQVNRRCEGVKKRMIMRATHYLKNVASASHPSHWSLPDFTRLILSSDVGSDIHGLPCVRIA